MTEPERGMGETPERTLAYTDAVVAIAQTLLILPLLESVAAGRESGLTTAGWLAENGQSLLWFLVSFVVGGSLWLNHRRTFAHVAQMTGLLWVLNFVWLFGIVFLSVASALFTLKGNADAAQAWLYIGSMLLCSASLLVIELLLTRRPELVRPEHAQRAVTVSLSLSMTAALLLALMLTLSLGFWGMTILSLIPLAVRRLIPVVRRAGLAG